MRASLCVGLLRLCVRSGGLIEVFRASVYSHGSCDNHVRHMCAYLNDDLKGVRASVYAHDSCDRTWPAGPAGNPCLSRYPTCPEGRLPAVPMSRLPAVPEGRILMRCCVTCRLWQTRLLHMCTYPNDDSSDDLKGVGAGAPPGAFPGPFGSF